jgi:hypothetical protein
MKFMIMTKADANYEAGLPPNPELGIAIGKLAEEFVKSGALVEMGGLLPSAKGARVQLAQGVLTVTDGPFAEAKELIGGYAIFRLNSKQEAAELAKRSLRLHQEVLGPGYQGQCEIRQMFDAADAAPAR